MYVGTVIGRCYAYKQPESVKAVIK